MARVKRGPKPRPPEEHRRNRVVLNFTDAEYAQLVKIAGAERVGLLPRPCAPAPGAPPLMPPKEDRMTTLERYRRRVERAA